MFAPRLKGIFKYAQQHEEAQLARSNQLDGVKFWTSQDKWDQWLERDINLENPHAKVPLTVAPCSPEDSQHFGKNELDLTIGSYLARVRPIRYALGKSLKSTLQANYRLVQPSACIHNSTEATIASCISYASVLRLTLFSQIVFSPSH